MLRRSRLLLLALLGTAVGALAQAPQDDVPRLLSTLGSGSLEERIEAEEALRRVLAPRHLDLLVTALERRDAEVERRLAAALGRDDRHLALAVLLLEHVLPEARAFGQEVVHSLALRWHPGALERPLEAFEWPAPLQAAPGPALALEASDSLFADLGLLARQGLRGTPVVVTPGFEEPVRAAPRRRRSIEGTALELLVGVAGLHSARPILLGGPDGPPLFLAVRTRGRAPEHLAGAIGSWLEAATRTFDPEANRRGCTALALSGWPAGLRWLEERAAKDEAALWGLVEAAGAGLALPGLGRAPLLPRLLALGDRAAAGLASGELSAEVAHADLETCARALRALALDPASAEGAAALAAWDELPEESRWLRLVGLAHGGVALLEPEQARALRSHAVSSLEQPGAPALRLAAIAVLAHLPAERGTLANEAKVLEVSPELAAALLALPRARRAAVVAVLAESGYAPGSAPPLLAFAWRLARGEHGDAAREAAALAPAGPWSEAWEELAASLEREGADARSRVLDGLAAFEDAAALKRWLLAGDLGEAGDAVVREALAAGAAADLALLARAATNAVLGGRAREALLERARDPDAASEVPPALRMAWEILGRRGMADLQHDFETEAERALREAQHPLGPGFARMLRESGAPLARPVEQEWRLRP